jgi:hypothetical protein
MIRIDSLDGIVIQVGAIQPTSKNSKYFRQVVIIHQPKDEVRGVTLPEEFFVITILSTSDQDSRFHKPEHKGNKKTLSAYLKGERWDSGQRGDFNYTHKLNLIEWMR